jgi:hypothetical protein
VRLGVTTKRPLVLALVLLLCALAGASSLAGAAAGSPAEPWVYYVAYPGGEECTASAIWRVHLDGSSAQEVLPASFDDFREGVNSDAQTQGVFSVSSTGQYIVRVLAVGDTAHLFAYDLQTGTVTQLTSGDTYDQWPVISPDGSTVAFMRSSVQRTSAGGGVYDVSTGNPSIYVMPITGGTLRRVPFNVQTGTVEMSWMPDGQSLLLGTEMISVRSGRDTPFVSFGAHAPYSDGVYASTWTAEGLLYDAQFGPYKPEDGGTRAGLPPDGLYIASHNVHLHGRLLRHYDYGFKSPAANAFYTLQLDAADHLLVAAYKGQIVTGPLQGGDLHVLSIPQLAAAHPQLAGGAEAAPLGIANPAGTTAAPSCSDAST